MSAARIVTCNTEAPEVCSRLSRMHHSGVRRVPHNERSSDGDRSSPRRFSNPGLYTGLFALLMALVLIGMPTRVEGKRGARIPDDLSDVTDHEEDASWREWGEGIKEHPKIRPLDPERKEDQDFKTMAMCVVTLSVPVMKERGRKLDGITDAWTKQLAQGGLQGRHMTLKPAGEFDIIFRYATEADIIEALEFVMRQPETESVLFKGTSYSKKDWRRLYPIEDDEDYWDDINDMDEGKAKANTGGQYSRGAGARGSSEL